MGLGTVLSRWRRGLIGGEWMRCAQGCSMRLDGVLGRCRLDGWKRRQFGGGWMGGCNRRSGRHGSMGFGMLLLQRKMNGSGTGEGRVSTGYMWQA